MGLIYDNNEAQQDSNTTREPLKDTPGGPPLPGEAESATKTRRRSLSDLRNDAGDQPSEVEAKARRPRLATAVADCPEAPPAEATPAAGCLTDLNALPDTQEQTVTEQQPSATEAEPVLEQAPPKSGRRRLAVSSPHPTIPEPPQTEVAPDALTDLDAASGTQTSAPRPGRPRLAPSEPAPQESESALKSSRPRMSAPVPEAQPAEPRVKTHRRRLGEDKSAAGDSEAGGQSRLDPALVQQVLAQLQAKQSLLTALVAGFLAAVVGGILWVVVTTTLTYRLGYMALAVGFLVGGTVHVSGRGIKKYFGWVGAGLSVVGCLLGNFLTNCVLIARETDLPLTRILEHLGQSVTAGLGLMIAMHPIDLVFYGIAIYAAYRLSFRRLTEAKISRLA